MSVAARCASYSRCRGLGYGRLGESALFIAPLFLIYELGLLFTPASNGVDVVSPLLFFVVGQNTSRFFCLQIGIAGVFLGALLWLQYRGVLALERVVPLVLESSIYALTLGSFILFVMDRLLAIHVLALGTGGLDNRFVSSLGAGIHEEIVFRLGGMGLGGILIARVTARRGVSVIAAVVLSSAAFAIAHHVGSAGEPFTVGLLVYRLIAGMVFAAIFYYRSLAHAVYSHALYDFYVLSIAS